MSTFRLMSWCRATMALGLVLVACAPPNPTAKRAPPPAETASSSHRSAAPAALEHAVLELVNRHRRARRLPPLTPDARITQLARRHSAAMATGRASLGHAGYAERFAALRRLLASRRTAENVAVNAGHREPAAEAVRGWLASRAHRAHIEGPYELTGVGVVANTREEVYFTQIFVGR